MGFACSVVCDRDCMPHCVLIFIFLWLLRCCSEPVGFLSFSPCRCPFVRPPFLPFMPTMFVSGLEWQGVRAWQFGALFLHSWHFVEGFHGLLCECGPCAEFLRGGCCPIAFLEGFLGSRCRGELFAFCSTLPHALVCATSFRLSVLRQLFVCSTS